METRSQEGEGTGKYPQTHMECLEGCVLGEKASWTEPEPHNVRHSIRLQDEQPNNHSQTNPQTIETYLKLIWITELII